MSARGGRGGGYDGRGRGAAAGGRGGYDDGGRGGRGGAERGTRGMDRGGSSYGRGGRGSGAPVAAELQVKTVDASSLATVDMPMSQPLLFGGSRDQALKLAVATVQRTAEERGADRTALNARKAAITEALQNVKAIAPGSAGTPASMLTNYFPVKSQLASSFLQYSVALEPELFNPRARRELVNGLLKQHAERLGVQRPIYIGHIAFAPRSLHPANTKEVTLQYNGTAGTPGWRSRDYRVTLTHTRDIAPPKNGAISTEYYNVLSSILSDAFSSSLLKLAGKYFDITGELQQGVEDDRFGTLKIMQGLNFVLHPTEKGLLLNVDVAYRTTRSSTVLGHWNKIKEVERDAAAAREMFKADVEGCMLATTYLSGGRRQAIKATEVLFNVTPNSPIPEPPTAGARGGAPKKPVTFKEYMQQQYNITLTDTTQPLIMALSKELDKEGNPRKYYFVPELCRFVGQSNRMRADTELQQKLKRMCLVDSTTRFNTIQAMMDRFVPLIKPRLQEWGITLETKMIKVQGRVLPPVKLTMGTAALKQQEERRSWLLRRGLQVTAVPEAPKHWVCVKPENVQPAEMKLFLDTLMDETINGLGCRWPAPELISYRGDRNPQRTKTNLTYVLGNEVAETVEFALIVLPDNNEDVYLCVKDVTLRDWRIPSQCVLRKNVINKPNVLNVASRIGAQMIVKQGGELWSATEEALPDTLVCGIDYASGPKGEVVALVACSTKRFACVYEGSAPAKKAAVATLLEKAMEAYKAQTQRNVANLIVYRAGMDEGDVPRIVDEEVLSVVDLGKKRKVGVCFLASLKRTHARFFNPPPGLVVDREILPRAGFAFLLVPQVVNIGTATAMKFCVLANTVSALASDGGLLEGLSFKLCHMFYGWWATTREPSVVMYATRRATLASKIDASAPLGPANSRGLLVF